MSGRALLDKNEREVRALSESTLGELRKLWRLAKPREER
jgi:hypothetical protein